MTLYYKRVAFLRSHYDATEMRIPHALLSYEIVVVAAMTDSGRP